MKRNRKVEFLCYADGPLGYLLDQDELEKLTADELREAISQTIDIIRLPDGDYTAAELGEHAPMGVGLGEIKQRADGTFKIIRIGEPD